MDKLNAWLDRLESLSLRERGLVLLTLMVVLVFLAHSLWIGPLWERHQQLQTETAGLQQKGAELEQQIEAIRTLLASDPDADQRARAEQLEKTLGALEERIESRRQRLILPQQMASVLEDVLRQSPLRLVSLETGEAQALALGEPTAKAEAQVPPVYRHALTLVLEGRYADVRSYLAQLESLRWELGWDSLSIEMQDYPTATITLKVHTLSFDEEWLGV